MIMCVRGQSQIWGKVRRKQTGGRSMSDLWQSEATMSPLPVLHQSAMDLGTKGTRHKVSQGWALL